MPMNVEDIERFRYWREVFNIGKARLFAQSDPAEIQSAIGILFADYCLWQVDQSEILLKTTGQWPPEGDQAPGPIDFQDEADRREAGQAP